MKLAIRGIASTHCGSMSCVQLVIRFYTHKGRIRLEMVSSASAGVGRPFGIGPLSIQLVIETARLQYHLMIITGTVTTVRMVLHLIE